MRVIIVVAAIIGVYMFTTETGRDMYDTLVSIVRSPITKANSAKEEMQQRNNKLTSELDKI